MDNRQLLLESYKESFKRGIFDFITVVGDMKHEKQEKALEILVDKETKEFAFGGAAGGSKSWAGCSWLLFMCLCYPGTRYFIGREELKRLRESTYITFLKVCKAYGVVKDEEWKYNGLDHFIQFENGSRIDLLDCKYLPSDPEFERYGSVEYTAGWLEEAGEIQFGCYDVLKSRIGRQLNDHYGLLGKLFVTLNPKKNWCYTTFWKPYRANSLPKGTKFLQAFVNDNPFVDSGYLDSLKSIKDPIRRERLLLGNFEYSDTEDSLIGYDAITDLFTNKDLPGDKDWYITADVARFGRDKSVIFVWNGFRVEEIHTLEHKKTTEVAAYIKKLQEKFTVSRTKTICDEIGVGGGVVDELKCKGFIANAAPLKFKYRTENYRNLKAQCYYVLSEFINERKMYVNCTDPKVMDMLTEELEQVRRKNADNDGKVEILSKDEVKEVLGRSPDYSDTLMMRIYFEVAPKLTWVCF
jgi:phage terminase large subunit